MGDLLCLSQEEGEERIELNARWRVAFRYEIRAGYCSIFGLRSCKCCSGEGAICTLLKFRYRILATTCKQALCLIVHVRSSYPVTLCRVPGGHCGALARFRFRPFDRCILQL